MSAVPKGPSREETRAMDRILKEPSRQTEQPSFFFPCILFPLDFKELYVGKDPLKVSGNLSVAADSNQD